MAVDFGGELRWGIKRSFRAYIEAAGGVTRVDAGASEDEHGRIVFPQVGVDQDGSSRVIRFGGGAVLEAHGGLLSLSLREPWLEIDNEGATLTVVHPAFRGPSDRRLPMCRLEGLVPRADGEELAIDEAPATLLIDATGTFDNLYPPGAEFDPVSARWRRTEVSR